MRLAGIKAAIMGFTGRHLQLQESSLYCKRDKNFGLGKYQVGECEKYNIKQHRLFHSILKRGKWLKHPSSNSAYSLHLSHENALEAVYMYTAFFAIIVV